MWELHGCTDCTLAAGQCFCLQASVLRVCADLILYSVTIVGKANILTTCSNYSAIFCKR